jgi:hypothetical protein
LQATGFKDASFYSSATEFVKWYSYVNVHEHVCTPKLHSLLGEERWQYTDILNLFQFSLLLSPECKRSLLVNYTVVPINKNK